MSEITLILAPVGRDADVAISLLRNAGVVSEPCQSVSEVCERLRADGNSVGALVLTEESLVSAVEYFETVRVQAAEKGIAVATLVEIPEAVACTVLGDEARLHQILGTLLGNSLKFTPGGGSVTVQLRRTRANAIIVVKDTGKGISPEFLPYIFERFSQDGASSRENGGLGAWLSVNISSSCTAVQLALRA
jgi:signal transduction histidine kinase